MSLTYLILSFSLLNLISPKLKINRINRNLEDDDNILNDGEENKRCNLIKTKDFENSYEFIGKLKSGPKMNFEIKISKEDCNKKIYLRYCALEDLSISSIFGCFWYLTEVLLDKKETENDNIFSTSFRLKKDCENILIVIEVPPNVDLNCVIIKYYSERDVGDDEDDGNSVLIIIVVSVIITILVGVGIVYYKNYIKNKELQKDYEQIKEEIHENKEIKK